MSRNIYAAVGHFKGNKNTVSVVFEQNTKKDFLKDCYGNAFVPYVIFTEAMLNKIFSYESRMDVYEQIQKMTTNYRVWSIITEYLTQAGYLITEKLEDIKGTG